MHCGQESTSFIPRNQDGIDMNVGVAFAFAFGGLCPDCGTGSPSNLVIFIDLGASTSDAFICFCNLFALPLPRPRPTPTPTPTQTAAQHSHSHSPSPACSPVQSLAIRSVCLAFYLSTNYILNYVCFWHRVVVVVVVAAAGCSCSHDSCFALCHLQHSTVCVRVCVRVCECVCECISVALLKYLYNKVVAGGCRQFSFSCTSRKLVLLQLRIESHVSLQGKGEKEELTLLTFTLSDTDTYAFTYA